MLDDRSSERSSVWPVAEVIAVAGGVKNVDPALIAPPGAAVQSREVRLTELSRERGDCRDGDCEGEEDQHVGLARCWVTLRDHRQIVPPVMNINESSSRQPTYHLYCTHVLIE